MGEFKFSALKVCSLENGEVQAQAMVNFYLQEAVRPE